MTQEEIAKLSDKELRIRVAELDGWKYEACHCGVCRGVDKVWCRKGDPAYFDYTDSLPDFPQDLNAMNKLERALDEKQMDSYCNALFDVIPLPHFAYQAITATARQRAEAFVFTMEGE